MTQKSEHTHSFCPLLSRLEITDKNENQINVPPKESSFSLYKNTYDYFTIYKRTFKLVMS